MKTNIVIRIALILFAGVAWSAWFFVTAQSSKPSPKIQWMNDAVYCITNSVWDDERNKTNPQPSAFFYTKTVIVTNKVAAWYFQLSDGQIELGARDDGVIVWRYHQ